MNRHARDCSISGVGDTTRPLSSVAGPRRIAVPRTQRRRTSCLTTGAGQPVTPQWGSCLGYVVSFPRVNSSKNVADTFFATQTAKCIAGFSAICVVQKSYPVALECRPPSNLVLHTGILMI